MGHASQKKLISMPCGKASETCHFATISLQTRVSLRSVVELKYLDAQFILNALAGSLMVFSAEGDFLLEDENFEAQEGHVGSGESD